jgi:hypothetical protein
MKFSTGPPWPFAGEFVCLFTHMFVPVFLPNITCDSFNLSLNMNGTGDLDHDSPLCEKPIDYPLLL